MKRPREELPNSISILQENIDSILTVAEWAQYVGYNEAKKFSYDFRDFYGFRPIKALIGLRLKNIIQLLTSQEYLSCYEVAQNVGLTSEKHLCNFTRHHCDLSPNSIRKLSDSERKELFSKLPKF